MEDKLIKLREAAEGKYPIPEIDFFKESNSIDRSFAVVFQEAYITGATSEAAKEYWQGWVNMCYIVNECHHQYTSVEAVFTDLNSALSYASEQQSLAYKAKLNVEYRVKEMELIKPIPQPSKQ
jgi:hypothetical protein